MTKTLSKILAVLSVIGIIISFVWVVIEFYTFIVKKCDFNWLSLISLIFFIAFPLVLNFFVGIFKSILVVLRPPVFIEKNKIENTKKEFVVPKRSRFQERLKQMEEKRNSLQNK